MKERLAACANIFPVGSVYRWKNRLSKSREVAALFKTTELRYAKLERRLKQLHSYVLPGIVSWKILGGSQPYLDWIRRRTNARN